MKLRKIVSFVLTSLLVLCLFSQAALAEDQQSLTTTFEGGNSQSGNMFNVVVSENNEVTIRGFDINLSNSGETINVKVYYRDGSYEAGEYSAEGWTSLGTHAVSSNGVGLPTSLDIDDLQLKPGQTYGFFITTTNSQEVLHYTNGDASYGDDNITITAGIGKGLPEFMGESYSPRIWNGTIYYFIGHISSGGESNSTKQNAAEFAFWKQVCALICAAQENSVVQVDLGTLTDMPRFVMRTLANHSDITLVLTYGGGQVSIPGEKALDKDTRSSFTLDDLKELYA